MADAKTRKQRMRQRRQQAGMKAALVWLTPEAQAAMAALRQPGETVDGFFNRALITLQGLMRPETSHAPSHRVMTADTRQSSRQPRTTAVPRGAPKDVPKDAPRDEMRPAAPSSYEAYRAMIVQRIMAMRAQPPPRSWQQIADAFNRERLATLSGRGRWDKSTIASLAKKYGESPR